MRRYFGAVLIVLGVLLAMSGLNASGSLGPRLSGWFMGSPAETSTWLIIGGACAGAVGVALACVRRGRPT
jgi:hypothetical protein